MQVLYIIIEVIDEMVEMVGQLEQVIHDLLELDELRGEVLQYH